VSRNLFVLVLGGVVENDIRYLREKTVVCLVLDYRGNNDAFLGGRFFWKKFD